MASTDEQVSKLLENTNITPQLPKKFSDVKLDQVLKEVTGASFALHERAELCEALLKDIIGRDQLESKASRNQFISTGSRIFTKTYTPAYSDIIQSKAVVAVNVLPTKQRLCDWCLVADGHEGFSYFTCKPSEFGLTLVKLYLCLSCKTALYCSEVSSKVSNIGLVLIWLG
jgi:hypothetical protein